MSFVCLPSGANFRLLSNFYCWHSYKSVNNSNILALYFLQLVFNLGGNLGEKVSLTRLTSTYFELREKFKYIEHIGKFTIWTKTFTWNSEIVAEILRLKALGWHLNHYMKEKNVTINRFFFISPLWKFLLIIGHERRKLLSFDYNPALGQHYLTMLNTLLQVWCFLVFLY